MTPRGKYRQLRPLGEGRRYGKLTAVRLVASFGLREVWRFRCVCGSEMDRYGAPVRRQWYHGGVLRCVGCR